MRMIIKQDCIDNVIRECLGFNRRQQLGPEPVHALTLSNEKYPLDTTAFSGSI